jgi:hypothetical protein
VFCPLLVIGEQFVLNLLILLGIAGPGARSGDRSYGDPPVPNPHQDFRARSDEGEAGQVEQIEGGTG